MSNTKFQFSAIVPVLNEEKAIDNVVDTLLESKKFKEIICINDGSTDSTLKILKGFGRKIILINFKKTKGKGTAVARGIKKSKGNYLFFCDGDLVSFTTEHIERMLEPIVKEKTKVVFAVPALSQSGKFARHEVYLAGERIYPRDALIPHISKLTRTKGAGGSEIVLNSLFPKKAIKIVSLIGLRKPYKVSKWSRSLAIKQYLLSAIGVLQESGRIEIKSIKDLKQLENLIQVDTFENLIAKIKEIKNERIKGVLEIHFTKYITKYVKKIRI